jgi:L-iditol 2-dehydrogenase
MKSMALTGLGQMEMISMPVPDLVNDNDVRVRVSHMGVCGSDMHYYTKGRIGSVRVDYPFVVGHEGSGIVEKTGSAVTGLKEGQRIAIEPAMSCHACDQCLAGRPHTCRNLKFLGTPGEASGLLAESIILPAECCLPLPDHMENGHAALAEPLSIGIWAGDLGGVFRGSSVGILGCGPIGMSVLLYTRYLGAKRIYTTDKLDYRCAMAESAGAGWTGNPDHTDIVSEILERESVGLDFVFDCCGKQEAMDQAIRVMKPGGKIVIVGIPEFEHWSLPADIIRRREIGFINVRRQNCRLQKAIDLIADQDVNILPLITHTYPFHEAGKAFDLVSGYRDGVMKAIIEF